MANPVELLFGQTPSAGQPVNLVFGSDIVVIPVDTLTLSGVLPAPVLNGLISCIRVTTLALDSALPQPELVGSLILQPVTAFSLEGVMSQPELVAAITGSYISNTERPTVGTVLSWAQVANRSEFGPQHFERHAAVTSTGVQAIAEEAITSDTSTAMGFTEGVRSKVEFETWFDNAARLDATRLQSKTQVASDAARFGKTTGFENAARAPLAKTGVRFQDGLRDHRYSALTRWQIGEKIGKSLQDHAEPARHNPIRFGGGFQEAKRPPAGISPVIVPPNPPGTYIPDTDLVFWDTLFTTHLVFGRYATVPGGATIVVPIRRIYMVLNNASLRRAEGNVALPTTGMGLSLNMESWTWSFNATMPGRALPDLEPSIAGEPVEVIATINGVEYRALIDSVSRDRTFGKNDLSVSGRGKTSILDAPYSPIQTFTNVGDRTAQQLMGDILSVNGVSMGWGINWGLEDWIIPAGVFSHTGSYLTAIQSIAAAAGGYLQPTPSSNAINVLHRYPVKPWDWGAVTPDYVLPSEVVVKEGIAWVEKARYNRVYVAGVTQGVRGQVTRTGTDGALLAPMVNDPLITTVAAARQRGISILGNTGRTAEVSLSLPVLPETGIILPGKFISYVDGGVSRLGITRSVNVAVGFPSIRQTLGVETHVS